MVNQPIQPDNVSAMLEKIRGNWTTQLIYVAAQLNIAEHLENGPLDCETLAKLCGVDQAALYRVLRALASLGIFQELPNNQFCLTELGELLSSKHPRSLRNTALMQGSERYLAWGDLLACVQTGDSSFERRFGKPVFEWNKANPLAGKIFNDAMVEFTRNEIHALLATYQFKNAEHIVDVGGGNGCALNQILKAHPTLRGTLFELPEVIGEINSAPVSPRFAVASGNFFESVPVTGDTYFLKNVLHDWPDSDCCMILGAIRTAVGERPAKLLIYEQLVPNHEVSHPSKLLDINMLVVHKGGKERTLSDYGELLERSGFQLQRVIPTACQLSVIEASGY